MKTKLALISLAAVGGFAAFATSASANPDIRVGIHFGAPAPVYRPAVPTYFPPAPVVVATSDRDYRFGNDGRGNYDRDFRSGDYDRNYRGGNFDHYHRPAGFWKEIVVRTWVPACARMRRDWHGRPVQVVEPGYFAYRT